MTAPASVFELLRNHARAAVIGLCILVIVAAVWGSNMNGRHEQASLDAQAAAQVRDSTDAAARTRLKDSLQVLRDSAIVMVQAQARLDSARANARVASATRITAANLARSLTSIDTAKTTASITITTDTGKVTLAVPPLVAVTWSNERAADTSAIASQKKSLVADSLAIAERDLRLRNDSLQSVARDSMDASYEAQLKAKSDEIASLQAQKNPRFTATDGALAGVIGTLAVIVAIAVVF